jgi:hypothetical protein
MDTKQFDCQIYWDSVIYPEDARQFRNMQVIGPCSQPVFLTSFAIELQVTFSKRLLVARLGIEMGVWSSESAYYRRRSDSNPI